LTGSVVAFGGFSGSLTTLADGSPYLLAGTNISITTGSGGEITITADITGSVGASGGPGEIQYNDGSNVVTASNKLWFDNNAEGLFVTGSETISGEFEAKGGYVYSPLKITGNYAIQRGDYLLVVSASSPVELTLPASPMLGKAYYVKDISGTATLNNITVVTGSILQRIDGADIYTIGINYGAAEIIYTDNNTWSVI
jgi:hypothetical protein